MKKKYPILVDEEQLAEVVGLPIEAFRQLVADKLFPAPYDYKGHRRWHLEVTLAEVRANGLLA